jgi:protein-L-isoaspartate(D-aspartate) O-methyltransferase
MVATACQSADAPEQAPAVATDQGLSSDGSPTPDDGTVVEGAPSLEGEAFADARLRMVDQDIAGLGISDQAVLAAMDAVPRHRFVPAQYQSQAYENHPLPIGYGQTISQPFVVALMTEAVALEGDDVVLEVGAGSGYQAAVLAQVAGEVYTIEIIEALAQRAEATLRDLGYDNVSVRHADGYFGWEEHAPYDAIVVTAAPDHIPQPLVDQLKIGGRMIIPVGPVGGFQTLWLVTKVGEEEVRSEDLGGVMFVPLTREERE